MLEVMLDCQSMRALSHGHMPFDRLHLGIQSDAICSMTGGCRTAMASQTCRQSSYLTLNLTNEQVRRPRAANIRRRDGGANAAAPPSAMRGQGSGGAPARLTGSKRVSISQPEIIGVEVWCLFD